MPKISIITINYNNLEGLKRTFESVFNQTYKDFEYIVIDGGSTDGSKELIEINADKITYWVSEPDKGIYNAMNKGILKATGEYLSFMNSGDEFSDNNIFNYLSLNNENKDLVFSDITLIDGSKSSIRKTKDKTNFYKFVYDGIGHQNFFIKKKLFETIGLYNEQLKYCSDWVFLLEAIYKNTATIKHIEPIICKYDITGFSSNPKIQAELYNEKLEYIKLNFSLFYDEYILSDQMIKNKYIIGKLKQSRIFSFLQKLGFFSYIKF